MLISDAELGVASMEEACGRDEFRVQEERFARGETTFYEFVEWVKVRLSETGPV